MARALRVLTSQDGLSTAVLSVFLIVIMLFVFASYSLISEVENDRAVAKAALDVALRSAAANGTVIVPGTTMVLWNETTALSAAEQAIPMALPVTFDSGTGSGATFSPNATAPQNWGTVSLSQFQTGVGPPPSCNGGSPGPAPPQSWVMATLTIPLRITFAGETLTENVRACDIEVANTYDGSQFNVP